MIGWLCAGTKCETIATILELNGVEEALQEMRSGRLVVTLRKLLL